MKMFLSLLLMLVVFGLLWAGRDDAWTETLPVYRRLESGETNPALIKVGDTWPLGRGTRLWFRTNETSYGEVLEVDGELVLIKWFDGDSDWMERHQIRSSLIIKRAGAADKSIASGKDGAYVEPSKWRESPNEASRR